MTTGSAALCSRCAGSPAASPNGAERLDALVTVPPPEQRTLHDQELPRARCGPRTPRSSICTITLRACGHPGAAGSQGLSLVEAAVEERASVGGVRVSALDCQFGLTLIRSCQSGRERGDAWAGAVQVKPATSLHSREARLRSSKGIWSGLLTSRARRWQTSTQYPARTRGNDRARARRGREQVTFPQSRQPPPRTGTVQSSHLWRTAPGRACVSLGPLTRLCTAIRGDGHHPNCQENFQQAPAEARWRPPEIPDQVNFFQNTPVDAKVQLEFRPRCSKATTPSLCVEIDLAMGVTYCSMESPPVNGERCTGLFSGCEALYLCRGLRMSPYKGPI